MATAMKYRDVERALLASSCTWKQGKGDHIKWYCPCGKHIAVVTQARTVSAGVVAGTSSAARRNRKREVKKTSPAEAQEAQGMTTTSGKTTHNVTAKRWKHGWELHIDGVGVTQSRTLGTAGQMVRDYIETLTGKDASGDTVVIVPELGALDRKVRTVREQLAAADRQQQEARNSYRALAADLRAAGLSVSDTAAILGVSRGRVSQLTKAS